MLHVKWQVLAYNRFFKVHSVNELLQLIKQTLIYWLKSVYISFCANSYMILWGSFQVAVKTEEKSYCGHGIQQGQNIWLQSTQHYIQWETDDQCVTISRLEVCLQIRKKLWRSNTQRVAQFTVQYFVMHLFLVWLTFIFCSRIR